MQKHTPRNSQAIFYKREQSRKNKTDNRKIGKYYCDNPKEHTNGEFDLVTEEEIAQVDKSGLACYKYVFFLKLGFEEIGIEKVERIDIMNSVFITKCSSVWKRSPNILKKMKMIREPGKKEYT